MDNWLILLIIAIIVILIEILSQKQRNQKYKNNSDNIIDEYPFKKKYLLSKNEYYFYKQLRKITDPKNIIVLTKVRLADLIEVDRKSIENKEYMKYFSKIQSKHIDFVLCDNDLRVLVVIELDDNSHDTPNRIQSDEVKNMIIKTAGIKLIRCKGAGNLEDELKKIIPQNE